MYIAGSTPSGSGNSHGTTPEPAGTSLISPSSNTIAGIVNSSRIVSTRLHLVQDPRERAGPRVEAPSLARPYVAHDRLGPRGIDVEDQQLDFLATGEQTRRRAAHGPRAEDRDAGAHYSGTWETTMMRGSVISSIA
ncbi:MAG: hypothetical protein ACT4PO_06280 [Actinomycetota bacterium]